MIAELNANEKYWTYETTKHEEALSLLPLHTKFLISYMHKTAWFCFIWACRISPYPHEVEDFGCQFPVALMNRYLIPSIHYIWFCTTAIFLIQQELK
jgi:hypothetical protein